MDGNIGNWGGAINNHGSLTFNQGSIIRNSHAEVGAVFNSGGTTTISDSQFTGNVTGRYSSVLFNEGGGPVNIHGSCIAGNSQGSESVGNYGSVTINAIDNWWGAANGPAPAGSGDAVNANVTFQPFQTSAPVGCPSLPTTPTPTPTDTPTPTPVVCNTSVGPGDVTGLITALNHANDETLCPGADTITLSPSSTYNFPGEYPAPGSRVALPLITSSITLLGNDSTLKLVGGPSIMAMFWVTAAGRLSLNKTVHDGNGSGVYIDQGTLTVQNSSFLHNQMPNAPYGPASSIYGPIDNRGGTVTITEATFTDNADPGVINSLGGAVNIANTTITGSQTYAIATAGCTLTISNTTITDTQVGNAVLAYGGSTVTITDSSISATLSNGAFGGAVYVADSNLTVDHSVFTNNSTGALAGKDGAGGAIRVTNGSATVSNSTFAQNYSDTGGAIYLAGSLGAAQLTNNIFTGNTSINGALAITSPSLVTLTGNVFRNNAAQLSGGAIFTYAGMLGLNGNILEGNSAPNGSAVYISNIASTATVQLTAHNSCFTGNNGLAVANNYSSYLADFTNNWWGAPNGPSGPGSGDAISGNANFTPFLISAPTGCTTLPTTTTLDVSQSAQTSLMRTFGWTIDSTMTPTLDLFKGDSGTAQGSVSLSRDNGTDGNWGVDGTISVHNPGSDAVPITGISDILSSVGSVTLTCGVAFPYALPAGQTLTCTYQSSLSDGTARTSTVTVTAQTASGGTASFGGPSSVDFTSATIASVNDQVTVSDNSGHSWTFNASRSQPITQPFTCPADAGTHNLVTTIQQTDQTANASTTITCHGLAVTNNSQTSAKRTFLWTVSKTAQPAALELFRNDVATAQFTVALAKDGGTDSDWLLTGTITIHNPAPIAATFNSVTDVLSPSLSAPVDCGVAFPYVLAAGDTLTCHYGSVLPDGSTRTSTAAVQLQNTPAGTTAFTGDTAVDFSNATLNKVNDGVTISDSDKSWVFNASGSQTYDQPYGCDTDQGTHPNTATIQETGQTASVSVTVNCHALQVSTTATTAFERRFHWRIDKTAAPATLNLFKGDSAASEFTVALTRDSGTDSDWSASGTVKIVNPASVSATINYVTDSLGLPGTIPVDCGVTFPYTLASGATLTCTYQTTLPDGTDRTNTAVVTAENFAYTNRTLPLPKGTTAYPATTAVRFGTPTSTVNASVTVIDTNGQSWTRDATGPVRYTQSFSCDSDLGQHTNTATIQETRQTASASVTVNCYALQASSTAQTSLKRTYGWSLAQTVAPDTWNLFKGDSATSQTTVALTKNGGTDSDWTVTGTLTVHNPAPIPAAVSGVTDTLSGDLPVNLSACSGPLTGILPAGATLTCNYSASLPDASQRANTVSVLLQNSPSGMTTFSDGTPINFGSATVDKVHDSVTVGDTNGQSWTFNTSGAQRYDLTYSCEADAGQHNNTATIQETGQVASASVTIHCFALQVTKTATATFKRTDHWTIAKLADHNSLTLALNQAAPVTYTVSADATFVDSDWAVSGDISITNPAPMPALVLVSDLVSPDIAVQLDCPNNRGLSLAVNLSSNETITCHYTVPLPDAPNRTNKATASLQNYSYDYLQHVTAGGTTTFTDEKAINFTTPTTEIDRCIAVTDSLQGTLGTVCHGSDTLPKQFAYSRNVGPYAECGLYPVHNTATFVAQDTGSSGSASFTVNAATLTKNGRAPTADLAVNIKVSNKKPVEGEVIQYVVTYANQGPCAAGDVSIAMPVPQGTTFQAATGGSYDPTTGTWNLGTLSAGQQGSITLSVKVDANTAGTFINASAAITSGETDPDLTNNQEQIVITVRPPH